MVVVVVVKKFKQLKLDSPIIEPFVLENILTLSLVS